MKKVTLLIPCYNEEESLKELIMAIEDVISSLTQYAWEILFVNDGSRDHTLSIIKEQQANNSHIAYVDLSRNFGKERALLAGFDYASGDCLVIMDADLQHPPSVLPEMLSYWEQGFDDVYARRSSRGKESMVRRLFSLWYYRILNKLIDDRNGGVLQNVGDFRLLDRKCIEALKLMRESERYTKGMYSWIGFRKKEIIVEQKDRIAGSSSYSFKRLFNLAIDGITSYSVAPLRLSSVLGLIISIIAFLYLLFVLFKTLFWGEVVKGYPTLVIIILFLGGVQLLSLGIIGEYLGRVFSESKHRPVYFINEYSPCESQTEPDKASTT